MRTEVIDHTQARIRSIRNNDFTNVYWTPFSAGLYSPHKGPYAFQLAKSGSTEIISTNFNVNYNVNHKYNNRPNSNGWR